MTDLKRLADDATTKVAIAVGRDAAKRAVDQLLSGEDKPALPSETTSATKTRRWKIVAVAVLGLFLIVGVIGLLLSYWYWFLAAGVLGLVGLVGWSRLRSRLAKRSPPKDTAKDEAPALEAVRVSTKAEVAAPPQVSAEARRAEAEARAHAVAEAHAIREQEVDEELAAMKARLKQ